MYGAIDELVDENRERGDADNVLARLSALTLAFAFALLSEHPEARERVQREAAALSGRPATYADLESLGFTWRVIQETLRLFPAAWGTGRECIEDDVIEG